MGEEHLDLLSQPHRGGVLFGFGDVACNLPGVFIFLAGDLARICIRAALHFRWISLTGALQRLDPYGIMTAERFAYSLLSLVPLLLFMPVGAWIGQRLSRLVFDRLILIILTILAVKLILDSLA